MNKLSSTRRALILALRKPAPDSVPMSGWERILSRDYYSTTFHADEDPAFLVDRLEGSLVRGRWVSRNAEPKDDVLPLADLLNSDLRIRQYLREIRIHYDSAREFVIHQHLQVPRMKLWLERGKNRLFSRKLKTRFDRVTVLRRLLDHATEMEDGRTVSQLMVEIYGKRWSGLEAGTGAYLYTEMLLKSLVESGDLNVENSLYSVRPNAISTLIEHEVEDRRHRDNLGQQRRLVWLTIVVAIAGAIQAYAAWTNNKKTPAAITFDTTSNPALPTRHLH